MTHWKPFSFLLAVAITSPGYVLKSDLESPSATARAAGALFEGFETVVYTDTDLLSAFTLHDSKLSDSQSMLRLPFTLRVPFLQLLIGLRPLGQVVATFYAAQLPGFIVIATEKEDFQEIVTKLVSNGSERNPYITVQQWNVFSSRRYWAHRSIRRGWFADADAAGLKTLAPTATALTFMVDVNERESFFRVYSEDTAGDAVPSGLPASGLVHYRSLGQGVWEAPIPLPADEATNNVLLQLFYYLGFGVNA